MRLLVTGAAGFIGSNFVDTWLSAHPDGAVTVLDKLTYAGNPANLDPIRTHPGFRFVHGDIADPTDVRDAMEGCEAVINFAAESHVDRSLEDPARCPRTNVLGVTTLLEEARHRGVTRFVQVSTDEVYGPLMHGSADEEAPLRPANPYSASKVGGEMMLTEADSVRVAGANSLEKLDHPASAEALINAIVANLKREEVMPAIFKAIGELGWQSAAAPLNDLLKKVAEPEIRTILPPALQALGQLGSLTSVDPLIELLLKLENGGRRNPWPNEGPIKNSAETALREITGMNLRGVAQWESWWKENQEASRARATRTYWVRKTQDRVEVGPTEKTPADSVLVASRIHTATGPGATPKKKKKGK